MPGKPYIDDDLYGEPPDNQDIDTGPLTLPQLQGLARDQIAALRNTVQEILKQKKHVVGKSVWDLLDMLDMLAVAIAKET